MSEDTALVHATTLVDANVLIDVATDDPVWGGWSADALASAADEGWVVINPIVYARLSVAYESIDEVDEVGSAVDVSARRTPLPGGLRRRQDLPAVPPPRGHPGVHRSRISISARTRQCPATAC